MKRILLVLVLICMIVTPVFSVGGTYTTNGYFYMPAYGAYGTDEFAEYNTYMQIADTQIEANKTLSEAAIDTSGTPVANDIPRFTDADTIEGLSYSELKAVLDLEIGTDLQAYDAGLLSIAALTTAANNMIYTTALDTYAIMDTFSEIQAIVADKTLINEEDAITLDSKLTLSVSADDAMSISMTGITGTDNQAIDVIGGEALGAEEHWTGIRVKPNDLDPGAADTRIRGVAINLSGVDVSNIPESFIGLKIVMPDDLTGQVRDNTSAINIAEGDIEHSFKIPNTVASEFTAYDMVIDASSLASTSTVSGFDVSVTGGAPSGTAVGFATHSDVDPLHQNIGSFSTPSQTEYAGRKTGGGVTWADGIDTNEIFIVNSDIIYMGSTAVFSEIEVIMTTGGSKTVSPTFWYNTAADTWTQFYPSDGTNGFQQNGVIRWAIGDISGSWTNDGDPGVDDSSAGYWIKIIRTGAPDPGTPTPTTVKTGVITLYKWDSSGDLTVHDIDANDIDVASLILDTALSPAEGGTGVANNAASTLTISGNHATTITVSAATGVTLPTSGTLLANLLEDTTPELGGELDSGAHTIGFTLQTATGDGATLINWTLGNKYKFTFGAQNETITFTNPTNPCSVQMIIVQDATGSRTITWSGMTNKWVGGTEPTLTTTANGEDVISWIFDGTSYYGVASLAFATP